MRRTLKVEGDFYRAAKRDSHYAKLSDAQSTQLCCANRVRFATVSPICLEGIKTPDSAGLGLTAFASKSSRVLLQKDCGSDRELSNL